MGYSVERFENSEDINQDLYCAICQGKEKVRQYEIEVIGYILTFEPTLKIQLYIIQSLECQSTKKIPSEKSRLEKYSLKFTRFFSPRFGPLFPISISDSRPGFRFRSDQTRLDGCSPDSLANLGQVDKGKQLGATIWSRFKKYEK